MWSSAQETEASYIASSSAVKCCQYSHLPVQDFRLLITLVTLNRRSNHTVPLTWIHILYHVQAEYIAVFWHYISKFKPNQCKEMFISSLYIKRNQWSVSRRVTFQEKAKSVSTLNVGQCKTFIPSNFEAFLLAHSSWSYEMVTQHCCV